MNALAQTLDSSNHAPCTHAVVCIGLEQRFLDIVQPLVSRRLCLKILSFNDPIPKLQDEIGTAKAVFVQWDGIGKKAHNILNLRSKQPSLKAVPVHILHAPQEAKGLLPNRQSKELAVSSWIPLPNKYFEIQRLLYDITGPEPEETQPKSAQPSVRSTQLSSVEPRESTPAVTREAAEPEEPRSPTEETAKPVFKELTLDAPIQANLESAMRVILNAWKQKEAQQVSLAKLSNALARERLVVVHPDEAFSKEISDLLEECGVRDVRRPTTVDETMAEVRRGITGVLIWFDGSSPMVASILEHFAESRQLFYVPILVILPSRASAETLSPKLRSFFFDAICFYDRKASTLKTALETMHRAASATNTPRAVLESLRNPLKLQAPPEKRRSLPLADIETHAQKLAERPGKKYWSIAETIPHRVIRGELSKSVIAVKELMSLRPHAFNTLLLRSFVAYQTPQKDAVTLSMAKAVLKCADLSADRLYRSAVMLERWKAIDALHLLLEGWASHPSLAQDNQLRWMAGKYYLLANQREKAQAFLAHAASQDPLRTEFAEGVGRALAALKQYDRAAAILRKTYKAPDCSWDGKILLSHVLLQCRNMSEAAHVTEELFQESPENNEILALKAKFS